MRVKVIQAIEKIFGGRRGPELNVHVVPVECTSYSSLDLGPRPSRAAPTIDPDPRPDDARDVFPGRPVDLPSRR
jgi:hypothetical protein